MNHIVRICMKTRSCAMVGLLLLVALGHTENAYASISVGVYYGPNRVIVEQGSSELHTFALSGKYIDSNNDPWIPRVELTSAFGEDEIFFSLDPIARVTYREWDVQYEPTSGFPITVYWSNPTMELSPPGEYDKRLRIGWKPLKVDPGGGIHVTGDVGGIIKLQVVPPVPEPATIALFALGGMMLIRRRKK